MTTNLLQGAGLGFRRELVSELRNMQQSEQGLHVDFFEIAPENWMTLGGQYAKQIREFTEKFPFVCHGLSLSIGSCEKLDTQLLQGIKTFLTQHNIELYTEHLSWCSDDGHLYDLLPIPCTEEAVHWVAGRILQAQDILGRRIGMENASYYLNPPGAEMSEVEFIRAVCEEADCLLHLDVNNIYVNSQNFSYDPLEYMKKLPLERVCYIHVAGHYVEEDGFIIDTHGADVIDPVWQLLEQSYNLIDIPSIQIPTCLERDFNFPPLSSLLNELSTIRNIQAKTFDENTTRTHSTAN